MRPTRCLLVLFLAAVPLRAADSPVDSKVLDAYIRATLAEAINFGTDLYNGGNVPDCVKVYRRALENVVPPLAGHAELQKSVQQALKDVEKDGIFRQKLAAQAGLPKPDRATEVQQQAWAFRAVMDDVRDKLKGGTIPMTPVTPVTPPVTTTKKEVLWDRLGGEAGVTQIVDDFVSLTAANAKVNFTRDGKYKPDMPKLKKAFADMISSVSEGPAKYTKNMKEVHKDMGVTDAEFDAVVADFRAALEKNKVKKEDVDIVLLAVVGTKKDIVTPKKPGKLEGTVTLDDKPLTGVTMKLFPVNDVKAKIIKVEPDKDGKFSAEVGLVVDEYKIAVESKSADVVIPEKYQDSSLSGLTVKVTEQAQKLDLALKSK